MASRKRYFHGFVLLLNIVTGVLFLLCSFASRLHPKDWWFTGFLGLFFPFITVLMLLFVLFWLLVKRSWAFISLVMLLVGFTAISQHLPLRTDAGFNKGKKKEELRVMSWNVRHFIPFDESSFKPDRLRHRQQILEQINDYQPDVICFQEFIAMPGDGDDDPLFQLKHKYGYKYHQFAGEDIFGTRQYSGIAIFSRYPIMDGNSISFPPSYETNIENPVYADILFGGDTIRIFSVHLQSFGFGTREYDAIDDIKAEGENNISDSKNILRKMRNTFSWHGRQADFLSEEIKASPHPAMVLGDLNDVPGSYAYAVMRGNREDAFLQRGVGLGATFTSSSSFILQLLPTLRIDYIFHPQKFATTQFMTGGRRLSDHSFLLADIRL